MESLSSHDFSTASPSSSEDLASVAEASLRQLQRLWDEIGLQDKQREDQLKRLAHNVALVYNNMLQQQHQEREKLKEAVEDGVEKICQLAAQLGDGEVEMAPQVAEMPLMQRLSVIEYHVASLTERRKERKELLDSLHEQLHTLWKELGFSSTDAAEEGTMWTPPTFHEFEQVGEALTLQRIAEYEEQIADATNEKERRKEKIQQLTVELIDLWTELEEATNSEFDQAVLHGKLGCSHQVIIALEARKAELLHQQKQRETVIKEHAVKIMALWDRLRVPEKDREAFYAKNIGLGPSVLQACKEELARLQDILQQSLKQLVEDARSRLTALWDELHVSLEERTRFSPFYSQAFTDILLEAHEEEIGKNQQLLAVAKPIMLLIERREKILEEKVAFESSSKDPTRLLTKGNRDPGRLLREEKFRKKVLGKELPQLEATLLLKLNQWEKSSSKPFLFNGKDYHQLMLQSQQAEKQQNQERTGSSLRLVSPARTNKPQSKTLVTTPKTFAAKTPTKTPLSSSKKTLQQGNKARTAFASRTNYQPPRTKVETDAPQKKRRLSFSNS
ncbi:Microtubule bundling protein [Balamuthia mandrillaris]